MDGVSALGNGDRGQSYSYASCTYGDWVYINTMYGGLGITAILGHGLVGLSPETVRAVMDVMYNGHLYYGEPDGYQAGGISGMGSGYETHMTQYTWQTVVYEGKLYVSTMDTTTLLTPIAQFTNGDVGCGAWRDHRHHPDHLLSHRPLQPCRGPDLPVAGHGLPRACDG